MSDFVTITSQGQISIPAKIREALGLKKKSKALIRTEKDKIIIEPAGDILSLKGVMHDRAIKGKSIDEIIKLEKEAVGKTVAEDYRRKFLKSK